ncbi:MAG: hypothetical protein BIFFINMI_04044 [Phycisphaerae bacterium]|nr:hypothetical protein [Phycisphaerae bacterium]
MPTDVFVKLSDRLAFADQPTEAQLRQLKDEGFATIVNLRGQGEANQPLSPADEGRLAESLGLAYLHIPVTPQTLGVELGERFLAACREAAGPVLVHCAAGIRAGLFAMIPHALDAGLDDRAALGELDRLNGGAPFGSPPMRAVVAETIRRHTGK